MIFPAAANEDENTRGTRIKICGVTNARDAALALDLGADALGLNFHPASPRALDLALDAAWLRELAGRAWRVAVVVNLPHEAATGLIADGLADALQLHGDENPAYCAALAADRIPFAKAIRVRDAASLVAPERFACGDLVLDAYRPGAYGGTGHAFDWMLAADFVRQERATGRRVILSGGLHPANVAGAIRQVQPFGVDVASGVEDPADPRRKDPAKLRAFIAAVRDADAPGACRAD